MCGNARGGRRKVLALSRDGVHRGKILATVAVTVLASLVQESAVSVVALFVSKERRTVFGCAVLRSEHSIAISGAIDGVNACRSIDFARESHIDTNALVRVAARLRLADHNLFDFAILTKVFAPTKRLEKLIFVSDRRIEADNVDQILLDNTDTG